MLAYYLALGMLVVVGSVVGHAAAHTDSITFVMYPEGIEALHAVSNNTLDMHTYPIPPELAGQAAGDQNLQVFDAAGAVLYTLYVNPAVGDSFNPFSIREVRYAMNHLLDRDRIVQDVLSGSGTAILSGIYPLHPDYPLVYRQMDALGISYDPILADRMIASALYDSGASRIDGTWHHGGSPVTVTIFVGEDPVPVIVAEMLAAELEGVGFVVERRGGDLEAAFEVVGGSDPADLGWHLYPEAYGGFTVKKYHKSTPAAFYGPWAGNMPGGGNPDYWNYENRLLDDLTYAIYAEDFESVEERARLVRDAIKEGVAEAVRLFIAVENSRFLVNEGVAGVVNAPGVGITTRYNTLNAQAPDGDLTVGAKYITQSAWNPVGGFRDTDTNAIWSVLRDPAYSNNPFTGDMMPVRVQWHVDTAGPDGMMDIPGDAIVWNPFTHVWETVPAASGATSKITLDFDMGNWHSGPMMDINDIMYPLYFVVEHLAYHEGHDHDTAVQPRPIPFVDELRGVRILDDDTIEVYTDYWNPDGDEIARFATIWSSIPWDLYAAMEAAAMDGKTAFRVADARVQGVSWLSMLDTKDTLLLQGYLEDFVDTGYVPSQVPYMADDPEYAPSRYGSTISWMEERGHSVISNGPYHLDAYWPENGTLRALPFEDPTYPIKPDHWDWLAQMGEFDDTILIGSVAPNTGGADRYGADITEASKLAISDFNEYLERRGESWSLESVRFDSMTDPAVLLHRLQALDERGIHIVDGPAIDIITDDIVQFVDDHNMVLLSCCASTPSRATEGDTLFRLLPDQNRHGEAIARLMYDEGVRAIAPVGIDAPWATELLDAATAAFEEMGGGATAATTYAAADEFDMAAGSLAASILELLDGGNRIDRVAVLYVGFGEAPEFMAAASGHKILGDIRWFGADQNTAWPNIRDDAQASIFAHKVKFTVVQPSVPDMELDGRVHSVVAGYLGTAPSPYAIYEYDTVWLLGLSVMYARSADPADVASVLPDVASRHVGLIGSTAMNPAGDLADTNYAAWTLKDGAWRLVANDY